jgi:hypothetical protein
MLRATGPGDKTLITTLTVRMRKSMRVLLAFLVGPDPDWSREISRMGCEVMLGLIMIGTSFTAAAQNLGTSPQFGQAVQGQQATTVEGTILNIVNWGCNVIAPVVAVACLGMAGWHFKSGRGYFGWAVTGVALMAISGLGRLAEGFITQAQGIQ